MPAELLANGRFSTLHAGSDRVEALLIQDGQISYVGALHEAKQLAARVPGCRQVDLRGRRVIPGLFDMHAHLDREGLKSLFPPMSGIRNRRDALGRIADLAGKSAPGEWIVTMPIGEPPFYFFSGTEEEAALYPTRDELDEAAPKNPVYIRPILGFWRWSPCEETLMSAANSAALAAVGLTDEAVPPSPSVVLERDSRGRLTGRFFESTTASILELMYFARGVAFDHRDRVGALRRSQKIASGFGITSVFEGHGAEAAVLDAYKTLHSAGELRIRTELCVSPRWETGERELSQKIAAWAETLSGSGSGDDHLRLRGLFVNAARNEDDRIRASCGCYTGIAGYYFDSALPEERIPDLLQEMARRDIRAAGLSRRLFRLFDGAHTSTPIDGKRWIVQHCGPLSDSEIEIAKRLRLGVSVLPVEYIYKDRALSRSSTDLSSMSLRRLVDSGVHFSLATDNIPPSVFFAIWLCLARVDYRGRAVPDPNGPLEREEVLKAATLWSAEALGCSERRGSLAEGKDADLVVLDRDVLSCPVDEIKDITALATMRGGEWIHISAGAPPDIRTLQTRQGRLQ